jgi:hypothetical protein
MLIRLIYLALIQLFGWLATPRTKPQSAVSIGLACGMAIVKMPFELGGWELSKLPCPALRGHLTDAIVA